MATIRINQLPEDNTPNPNDVVPLDNGTTRNTTIQQLVDTGAPVASQGEAEAGVNAAKRMTPLTTKQAIEHIGAQNFATLAQLEGQVEDYINTTEEARDDAVQAKNDAESARDDAESARDDAEDARDVATSMAGTATGAATTAQTSAGQAMGFRNQAETARDFAARWASDPEDGDPIDDGTNPPGQSSFHHAKKSEGFKDLSQAWAESEGQEPGGPGTKSSFEWSEESRAAKEAAEEAASSIGFRDFSSVTTLLADTSLEYGTEPGEVQVADIIRTRSEGFAYEVVAYPTADYHVATAGGVLLYALPSKGEFSVEQFGATLDAQDPVDRRTAMQRAIDVAAEQLCALLIPAGEWVVSNDLFYRSNSSIFGAGKDITTIKLSDDADPAASCLRPSDDDMDAGTENVVIKDLTGDANADRANITELPTRRPNGGVAILIAHVNGFLGQNLHGTNAVLHGIDISPGGDVVGGERKYNANLDEPSTKPSSNVILIDCEGSRAGDDGITTHYSNNIWLFRPYGHSSVERFSGTTAPNGIEIDEGSWNVWCFAPRAHDVVRGVVVANHPGTLRSRNINIFGIQTKHCTQGLYIIDRENVNLSDTAGLTDGHNILVDGILVESPRTPFEGVTPGSGHPSLSAVGVRGVRGTTVRGIRVDGETDHDQPLAQAIIVTEGSRDTLIDDYYIENWSSPAVAVVQTGSQSKGTCFKNGRLINCNSLIGVNILGDEAHSVDGLYGDGSDVANSVLLQRGSSNPFTNGDVRGVSGSGYTHLRADASNTKSRSRDIVLGDLALDGYIQAGTFTSADYHRIFQSTASAEVIRIDASDASSVRIASHGQGNYGVNAAATVLGVNSDIGTSRSINARGSINASGADYAEYHQVKPHLWGNVAKGAILGYAADGLLTDRFDDVVGRFVIKSTRPYGVGGDDWGSEEKLIEKYGIEPLGEEPSVPMPDLPENEDDEAAMAEYELAVRAAADEQEKLTLEHAARHAAMMEVLEIERVKWDRIAKAGYVPVNISATEADIGKYLVPVAVGDGITADLVAEGDLTMLSYIRSIGCVIGIAEDGRPLVEVKVG